jgi:membrane-bound lytic murein transglycosylase
MSDDTGDTDGDLNPNPCRCERIRLREVRPSWCWMILLVSVAGCATQTVDLEGTAAPNVRIVEAVDTAIPVLAATDPESAARWRRWIDTNPQQNSIPGIVDPMVIRSIPGNFKITAYAAPILDARREADEVYRYPILAAPPPEIETATLPTRRQLADGSVIFTDILGWVANGLDAYLAEVNGSTALRFPGGELECLAWVRTNEREYTSLGRRLVDEQLADLATIDLDVIRTLHDADPETVERLMLDNDRVVFFEVIPADRWPRASTGVQLIPRHALAVDPEVIPLGSVVMIEGLGGTPIIAVAVDIGGAIKGRRLDLYLGAGAAAVAEAGRLVDSVQISIIKPVLED